LQNVQNAGARVTWTEYFRAHAAEAERKAASLSGYARDKQKIVARTFRLMARDAAFKERLERKARRSPGQTTLSGRLSRYQHYL
jgi:hypothetical protein